MATSLALLGGPKAVNIPHPHEPWPPVADEEELSELARQRNLDISIVGKVGPIAEFEDMFLAFLENQVNYAISFNSGTSALLAAYFALNVEEGDEVIGPALTFHAALSPVFVLGGNVVLVDVDIRTRCIDPGKIENAITEKTKVITLVHQWGHPCEVDEMLEIAHRHDLKIIEDCSHAHGSRYKGKLCGTLGDVAVFSLQTNKAIFGGEGGVLVTNDATIHNRATLLGHYRDRSKAEIQDAEYRKYWITGFGLKLRMSPFNAIVAKHSLKHFPKRRLQRHRCLNYMIDQLHQISFIEPPYIARNVDMGAWYGFKPLYNPEQLGGLSRDILVEALQAEGVQVSVPSGPLLASLPLYSETRDLMFPRKVKKANSPGDFPIAQDIERRGLSLPTFTNWETDKAIIDQYISAFKKVGEQHQALLDWQASLQTRRKFEIPEAELVAQCQRDSIEKIVVAAAVIQYGKLLLVRRAPGVFMEGVYELPGGIVEEYEILEMALRRQVAEEVGLEVANILGMIEGFDYEYEGQKVRQFNFVVEVSDHHVRLTPGEHDRCVWITQELSAEIELTDEIRKVTNSFFALQNARS